MAPQLDDFLKNSAFRGLSMLEQEEYLRTEGIEPNAELRSFLQQEKGIGPETPGQRAGRPWLREAGIMGAGLLPYAFPLTRPVAPWLQGAVSGGLRAAMGDREGAQATILPTLLGGAASRLPGGSTVVNQIAANLAAQEGNKQMGLEEPGLLSTALAAGLPALSKVPSLIGSVGRAMPGADVIEGVRGSGRFRDRMVGALRPGPKASELYDTLRPQLAGETVDLIETRAAQQLLAAEQGAVKTYMPGLGAAGVSRVARTPLTPVPPLGLPIFAPGGGPPLGHMPPTAQQLQDYDDLLAIAQGRNVPFDTVWRIKNSLNKKIATAQGAMNPDAEEVGALKLARSALQNDLDHSPLSPALREADATAVREHTLNEMWDAFDQSIVKAGNNVEVIDGAGMLKRFYQMRHVNTQGRQLPDKFFEKGLGLDNVEEFETFLQDLAVRTTGRSKIGLAVFSGSIGGTLATTVGANAGLGVATGVMTPGLLMRLAVTSPKYRRMVTGLIDAGEGAVARESLIAIVNMAEQERAVLSSPLAGVAPWGPRAERKQAAKDAALQLEIAKPEEQGEEDFKPMRRRR